MNFVVDGGSGRERLAEGEFLILWGWLSEFPTGSCENSLRRVKNANRSAHQYRGIFSLGINVVRDSGSPVQANGKRR